MARKPIFVLPLDLGTIAAGNTLAGFPASHLNRPNAIGLVWQSEGNSNLWIRGQFATPQSIDCCAVIAANALPGTMIRLRLGTSQEQVDGTAPYDSGPLPFISPLINRSDGLYHSHLELPSVQTGFWWRIDITGHTGNFQAASIVMGQKIEPSRFYNFDFEYGIADLGGMDFGRFGVPDEEPGRILRTIDFTLGWQTEVEWEERFRPMLEKIGVRGFVYLCFDPTAHAYRQAKTFLGVMAKPPYAKGTRKPATFSQDFSIKSVI